MKSAVAVTGLGVVSPIGLDPSAVLSALRDVRSGVRVITPFPLTREFPAAVVDADFADRFTRLELPFLDRTQQLAIVAARQALDDAGIDQLRDAGERAGVHYGNVNGGAQGVTDWGYEMHVKMKQSARPFSAMSIMGNAGGAHIGIRNGVLGPVLTHASACASSGVAIGEAARAIADGYLDVVVAGGAEAPLAGGVVAVFQGTRAQSAPDPNDVARTCKPFSSARSGLVLGEGAAFLVLESIERATRRGARIHGYVTGYGITSDAHHIGMPESGGQARALRAALRDAGLAPGDIGYINAHATGTHGGDVIEAAAIREVFGDGPSSPPVSSTKGMHGHLLGATSALELVISLLALGNDLLPASAHMDVPDPDCSLNHVGPVPVRGSGPRHALSHSCGFGGTNVALIVSKHPTTSPHQESAP